MPRRLLHNGDEFLPAFFAWGRYDYLLAGPYQSYVSRYIEPLSNVDVKLYGYRETIEERIEKIGHLIFNHYTLGSDKELEDPNPLAKLFNYYLRTHGVNIRERPCFISTAHSDADFEKTYVGFEKAIAK